MRRAIRLLLLVVAALPFGVPPARAQGQAIMNGIGLVDYTRKPNFKVGDWAKYHMQSRSQLGVTDDYTLTVLIAGEEDFWGDPCFWLETWVDKPGDPPQTRAALMSYEIFTDSSATERLLLYMRKMITMLKEDGTPQIDINKPAASTFKARHDVKTPVTWTSDTLGVDTVQTPKGTFTGRMIRLKQGKGVTQAVGDSSIYTELREDRTSWYTNDVPITHLAREDIVTTSSRKSWLIGRSGDSTPLGIRDKGIGTARLIDFGHGLEARLLPVRLRRTIAEQRAAAKAPARASRPTAARKQ